LSTQFTEPGIPTRSNGPYAGIITVASLFWEVELGASYAIESVFFSGVEGYNGNCPIRLLDAGCTIQWLRPIVPWLNRWNAIGTTPLPPHIDVTHGTDRMWVVDTDGIVKNVAGRSDFGIVISTTLTPANQFLPAGTASISYLTLHTTPARSTSAYSASRSPVSA
jgi:hypothetical protein